MEKYINYILTSIIKDVENFTNIYNQFEYGTWLFVWILWLCWIVIKYSLLTLPIWQTFNLMFTGKLKGLITNNLKLPDNKQKENNSSNNEIK